MKKPAKSRRKSSANHHHDHETTTTNPGIEVEADDFAFNISKVAVSQICRSVGLRRSEGSALATLTMVATKYVEALGKTAVSYSNAAGRTQSNLVDLIDALHDLSLLQGGFEGASTLLYYKEDANCCPFNSTVLEALCRFVNSTVEMPFAKPIHRPKREEEEAAAVNNKASSSSSSSGNNMQGSGRGRGRGRGAHVPEWLPGFPDVGISSEKCEKKKRVSGEEHWENCCSSVFALGCQGQSQSQRNGCLEEEKRNGDKLAKKRTTRVKFRINGGRKRLLLLNTFGGGGGINKLLTQTKTKEETEAEVESTTKAQILVYKRRKQR